MNASLGKLVLPALAGALLLAGCERPPADSVQQGYRGTGMVQIDNPRLAQAKRAANGVPEPLAPAEAGGPTAAETYQNVQVLGDLSVGEFTRLMVAITAWVSPEQGCAYCHEGADFAAESLYPKTVARRMLQMTRHINSEWKTHVAQTGVTCYTCHRGKPVPSNIWFTAPPANQDTLMVGARGGQNIAAADVGLTSLPFDPFSAFLAQSKEIRVISTTALPAGSMRNIKQTESTYALMIHMSQSLGVNCTFCHNSRSFAEWNQSSPKRVTAWHGIRMVADLNGAYLEPLRTVYPPQRLGPLGDAPKANCTTCHQGVSKPLYGASMLQHHPELASTASARVADGGEAMR